MPLRTPLSNGETVEIITSRGAKPNPNWLTFVRSAKAIGLVMPALLPVELGQVHERRGIPSLDLERVGIYGGSAGGQSALRALLAHGDFYRAAAADCGCHDNRMDKIWWNELWMGWPLGPHYAEQSNVTQAHRLQGKLLLIVGALDRNVDPASTMQVVNALVQADKDFELAAMIEAYAAWKPGADSVLDGAPSDGEWRYLVDQ